MPGTTATVMTTDQPPTPLTGPAWHTRPMAASAECHVHASGRRVVAVTALAILAVVVGACGPAVSPAGLPEPVVVPSFDPAASDAPAPTPRIIVIRPTPIIVDDDDPDDPDDGD